MYQKMSILKGDEPADIYRLTISSEFYEAFWCL